LPQAPADRQACRRFYKPCVFIHHPEHHRADFLCPVTGKLPAGTPVLRGVNLGLATAGTAERRKQLAAVEAPKRLLTP